MDAKREETQNTVKPMIQKSVVPSGVGGWGSGHGRGVKGGHKGEEVVTEGR